MTREEAIEILRNQHRWTGEPEKINEVQAENEALYMAIKELEQEPCVDCISREEAIKLFTWTNTKEDIWYGLKALPSVKPIPCDCISIKAAIDKMQELEDEDIEAYGCLIPEGFDGKRAIEALKTLPSIRKECAE